MLPRRINSSRIFMLMFTIYAIFLLYTYRAKMHAIKTQTTDMSYLKHKEFKYILQSSVRFSDPFQHMGEGNSAFIKNNCKFTNCFVTDNSKYFINQSYFDAVVYNGRDVTIWPFTLPANRSPTQKYIFGAMESPDRYPVCNERMDGFFNWTWTYRLDSDFRWGYITIYDLEGNVVGPAIDMKWPELDPIDDDLKSKLASKSKAAAWLVSHCKTLNKREDFVEELQTELREYGWSVDIYGACGIQGCPKHGNSCHKRLENNYYFYLSFENSFAEDYVTEKLLTALHTYTVPIVYGAANYSRFLPPGSYLNARELGAKELARQMSAIISDATKYHDFFRWRNHYVYKGTSFKEDICKLCEMMNDQDKVSQVSVWSDLREWWNIETYKERC